MENRKNESDLSIEELLKALDGGSDEPEAFISDPIFSFIETFGIKDGPHKVRMVLLYELFKKWNRRSKMPRNTFYTSIRKYLTVKNVSVNAKACVNKEITDLIKHLGHFKSQNIKTNHKKTQNHFNKFLEIHNIKTGDLYIEADVLYHIYDTWIYRNNIHQQLSYERFQNICELHFDTKEFTGSELLWFGVDDSIKQHISIQAVTNWRQGRAKRGKKSKVSTEEENSIIYPETQK
jgi:hypothetical protein